MGIKLIVTDLDNTLLRRDKTISDYTIQILDKCRKSGILLAFATARPARVTERFRAALNPDAIIADNGAVIVLNGETIARTAIPNDNANRLLAALAADRRAEYICAECGDCQFSTYAGKPWDIDWEYWNIIYSNFSAKIDKPVTKISVCSSDKIWVEELLKDYPNLRLYSNIGEDWRQITRREACKWNGLQTVLSKFGLTAAETAVFGDDMNDFELIRECGVGVAVSNALDEVKAAANYTCGNCDDDGVAKWLEEHVL